MHTISLQKPAYDLYFVAIVCPEILNEKIHSFKQWMKDHFGCVVALRSPAHITLVPPFRFEREQEESLLQTLQGFSRKGEIPLIDINGFDHFGRRVLFAAVTGNDALQVLKSEVEEHFIKHVTVIKPDDRPFHPHITIANRDMKPSHFVKAWERFSKINFTETFSANTISLLRYDDRKWKVIGENRIDVA